MFLISILIFFIIFIFLIVDLKMIYVGRIVIYEDNSFKNLYQFRVAEL